MRTLLGAAVAALLLATATLPATAVVVTLSNNPTSATGNFQLAPGGGAFEDQVQFGLTGPATITIANATNTYANAASDFITNWVAAIWSAGPDQIVNNSDDVLLFGPQAAQACNLIADCQFVGGSGVINGAGLFYAEFTGVGGGTSGYSGNISTSQLAAVPLPAVGSGLPMLIAGLGGLMALNRRRRRMQLAS